MGPYVKADQADPKNSTVKQMARRFRSSRGFARKTTNYHWSGIVDTANSNAGAGAAVLMGSLSLANQGIDETLLRIVARMHNPF